MYSNVILIGFMGTGKSTIGRALARLLDWRFVDTDTLIEKLVGCDIATQFQQEGESAFRARESTVILGVSAGERQVIATGGGAILRDDNVRALQTAGLVVLLTARADTILGRIRHRPGQRPLLETDDDPLVPILHLLAQRSAQYQRAAHVVVDTSDRSPSAIAQEILRLLQKERDANAG